MTQIELFEPLAHERVIEALATEALSEIKAAAEHARRSIGQKTRIDFFKRRVFRASATRAHDVVPGK